MKPTALLVTMSPYWGVARRLRDIKAHGIPGVDVRARVVRGFDDIPPLLRSRDDLIALDGHGWSDDQDAYFGTGKRFTQFCPDYLRSREGAGIVTVLLAAVDIFHALALTGT